MKIHLLDGTYELFRSFYGPPPRKAPDGREVGATASLGGWALFVVLLLVTEGGRTALYAAIMLAIVTWRHKDNIQRLLRPAQA